MTDPTPSEVLAAREICAARTSGIIAAEYRGAYRDDREPIALALAGIRAGLAMREAEVARLREALVEIRDMQPRTNATWSVAEAALNGGDV